MVEVWRAVGWGGQHGSMRWGGRCHVVIYGMRRDALGGVRYDHPRGMESGLCYVVHTMVFVVLREGADRDGLAAPCWWKACFLVSGKNFR